MDRASENPGVPWGAVDGLGRVLPSPEEVGPAKPDRFVGIFYFLWLGQHDVARDKVYDVSKILKEDPEALKHPTSPPWGPMGQMHFWGEPLFGYYLNSDPWVLRRHAALLTDAGIDTLIFDTTNRVTYRDVVMKLCETFTQIRQEGGKTPQITFMVNTEAGATADELFDALYKPGLYSDLWFRWQGKPLLICDPAAASPAVQDFFTLRKAHWPFEQVNTPYAWHWEAAFPQVYGTAEDPKMPEQVNVSVAQNLRRKDGAVTNMSRGDARGRSFHQGRMDATPGAVNHGHNFQEQWERALSLDPAFIMVTGWNEWIAGRYSSETEPVMFVDQFDEECSRDIEMMRGGHQDNYYYQLVAGVRRYKGAPPAPKASAEKSIEIDAGFEQWDEVSPEYLDQDGETLARDHAGVADLHYKNQTGRNEFRVLKVARDRQNLYFYARTREPISDKSGSSWMMLFIDADSSMETGWEGYEFVVNRRILDGSKTLLERHRGGWDWEAAAEVRYRVEGNQLHLAIPRSLLGIPKGKRFSLDFKWMDNLPQPVDVMDFYTSGDVAPNARFRYRYVSE